MREYRSAMFVPGASEKMLGKAAGLDADLILFDLEDSVLPEHKQRARELVAVTLNDLKQYNKIDDAKGLGVRVNDLSSGQTLDDLKAVLPEAPDLIVLPKVETGSDLDQIAALLEEIEASVGIDVGCTKLIVLAAETPKALFNFDSLNRARNRVVGMTWGAEDLASELGAAQGRDSTGTWLPPFQYAQTLCLVKSRDLGIQPLDTVYADVKNLDGLRAECVAAKQIGFTGKLAIHPAQIAVINEVFSPSEEDIADAKRIIELFEANPGAGALNLDGKMVDIPHLRAARNLLETCKR